MAAYPAGAIPLTSFIGTTDPTDTYATHYAELGNGGARETATSTTRNLIPVARRSFGMTVTTQDFANVYMLCNVGMGGVDNSLANNSNWINIPSASTKANITLNNLGSTAVNVPILPAFTSVTDFGSSVLRWRNGFFQALRNSSTNVNVHDLVNFLLNDTSGFTSLNHTQRTFVTSGVNVGDWSVGLLRDLSGDVRYDWFNGINYYGNSFGGGLFESATEGVFYDPDSNPAIDVGNRTINWPNSGPPMINFLDGYFNDSNGVVFGQINSRFFNGFVGELSFDVGNHSVCDFNEIKSVDGANRWLLGPLGSVLVDFSVEQGPIVPTQLPGDNSGFAANTGFVQALATQILTALSSNIALKQNNLEVATNLAMYSIIASGAYSVYGHGNATVTEVGASARGILGTNSAYARASRRAYVTTAVAGNASGARQGSSCFSNAAPFDVLMEFGTETPGLTGIRALFGFSAAVAVPANIDYTSLLNTIGVARIAGSDNFHLITNDATGTATAINLGANFPANTNFVDLYTLRLKSSAANGPVTYTVTRYPSTNGAPIVATGIISTDLPASNSTLQWQAQVNNNTQATAVSVTLSTVKLEWNK